MKVFLSASRQASPVWIEKVVSYLQKYMPDVEIVRYAGGSYSSKPMLACDMVIMIPPAQKEVVDFCHIGKGQTSEFQEMNKADRSSDVYIVRNSAETLWCKQAQSVKVKDIDWTNHYATISFKPDYLQSLEVIIGRRKNMKEIEQEFEDLHVPDSSIKNTFSRKSLLLAASV